MSQPSREQHFLKSVQHALDDFNRRHEEDQENRAKVFVDNAVTEGLEMEIFLEAAFTHYPLRRYNDLMNAIKTVVRDYDRIGKRSHKKDDNHLNKHAMHPVRLFMMGIDILERGEIRTHRPENDLSLLLSIRSGDYIEDGVPTPAFYEIVSEHMQNISPEIRTGIRNTSMRCGLFYVDDGSSGITKPQRWSSKNCSRFWRVTCSL